MKTRSAEEILNAVYQATLEAKSEPDFWVARSGESVVDGRGFNASLEHSYAEGVGRQAQAARVAEALNTQPIYAKIIELLIEGASS